MPSFEPLRVYISYARKDGAALAQRLQKDLPAKGFDAWLDTERLAGGATWTTEIEQALDACQVALALLTPGSYVSEICRAEQLRALRKGKRVIPLLAQAGSDIPLHLATRKYRDFTGAKPYSSEFELLLEDIRLGGDAISLRPEFFTTYVTTPPLPRNYVERPEALANLRNALITDGSSPSMALTALEGMGGIGKTILAQALCHNEVVQQAFPDGVVWITAGKEPAHGLVTRMREVGKALKDDLAGYDTELGCINRYRTVMREKAALIVVDDVWYAGDVEPFRAESRRSRLLFTTRDASIAAALGAEELIVDLLTPAQSRELLACWSGSKLENLPVEAAGIIQECGRLPLALAMIGAMLRGKPGTDWDFVYERLRNADIEKSAMQLPEFPYASLRRLLLGVSRFRGSANRLDDPVHELSEKHHIPFSNTQRVFLCHSSKDKKTVRQLYHRLLSDGFNPWLDEQDILPGQQWELEITKAVRSSAIVLVCLSSNAVNQAGYIHKEIKNALDIAAEQPEGTIFIIPVRLDECDVPERLRQWQWVNFFEARGYSFLLKALAAKGLP